MFSHGRKKKTTFLCKKRVYYFSVISHYGDSFRHFQTISKWERSAVDFEAINSKQYIVTFGLVKLKLIWDDDVLLNTDLKPACSRYFLIAMPTGLFAMES